jgi:hypothetical protein
MCGRSRSWRRYELRHGAVPVGETEVSESAEGELGGDEGQHAPSEAGPRSPRMGTWRVTAALIVSI